MSPDREVLKTLIQRIEEAGGPDRELDLAIGLAIGGWELGRYTAEGWFAEAGGTMVRDHDGDIWPAHPGSLYPALTESIDAALALVERCLPGQSLVIARGRLTPEEPLWACQFFSFDARKVTAETEHEQAPLAICLALLRALQDPDHV